MAVEYIISSGATGLRTKYVSVPSLASAARNETIPIAVTKIPYACGPIHQVSTSMLARLIKIPIPYRAASKAPPRNAWLDSSLVLSVPLDRQSLQSSDRIAYSHAAAVLRREHSAQRKDHSVYKLIVHHHKTGIDEVNPQQDGP